MASTVHDLKLKLVNSSGNLAFSIKTPKTASTPKFVHHSGELICERSAQLVGALVQERLREILFTQCEITCRDAFALRLVGAMTPDHLLEVVTSIISEGPTAPPHMTLRMELYSTKTHVSYMGSTVGMPTSPAGWSNLPGPLTVPASLISPLMTTHEFRNRFEAAILAPLCGRAGVDVSTIKEPNRSVIEVTLNLAECGDFSDAVNPGKLLRPLLDTLPAVDAAFRRVFPEVFVPAEETPPAA